MLVEHLMKKVVLIACSKRKFLRQAEAEDLYISPLFKLNLQYARILKPDFIFILSAKHGLVELGQKLTPYGKTLNTMDASEIRVWAEKVIDQLKSKIDLNSDEITFLAGEKYRKYLLPFIKYHSTPLKNLSIGKQLQYLSRKLKYEK